MTSLSLDTTATLAQLGFDIKSFFMIFFVVVSVVMILIVLIQRPQGGGLSGAFGASADGAGQTAFGAKTGDALTFATVAAFLIFLGTAIALNFNLRPAELSAAETTAESTEADPDAGATTETDGVDLGTLGSTFGGGGADDTQAPVSNTDENGNITRLELDENGQPIIPEGAFPLTPEQLTPDETPEDG